MPLRLRTRPCKDCGTPTVFAFEPQSKSWGPALLCDACLAVRVTAVQQDAPCTWVVPRVAPAPQTAAHHRLVALATAHPSWPAQALAHQLNADGFVKRRGGPWDKNTVRALLVRWGLWRRRRPTRPPPGP